MPTKIDSFGATRQDLIDAINADSRRGISLKARGIIAETLDGQANLSTTAITAGDAWFGLVGFKAGDLVSAITVALGTGSGSVTLVKVGIYDLNGVQLAVSASNHANFGTGANGTMVKTNLTAPYTILSDNGYYLAYLPVGAGITLYRGNNQLIGGLAVGTGAKPLGTQTGLSDLPATAAISAGAQSFYMAAS
jgi:hypothetical protein